jgi:hypothetical protein
MLKYLYHGRLNMLFLCAGFVDWLEKRQAPCFYKSLLGVECPGCGMQRAFIALLRGDWLMSLKLYPALIPTIIMMVFLAAHIIFKLKNGAKILLYMFIINVVIISISYIYKLII